VRFVAGGGDREGLDGEVGGVASEMLGTNCKIFSLVSLEWLFYILLFRHQIEHRMNTC
jgi:hypothetical protein